MMTTGIASRPILPILMMIRVPIHFLIAKKGSQLFIFLLVYHTSNAEMNFLNPQGRALAYAEPCKDEPKRHYEP
jgi:hypothetical protein